MNILLILSALIIIGYHFIENPQSFVKIKNIIKSRFIYRKDVPQWVADRRTHCNGCKYNFKNKKTTQRSIKDYWWYGLNGFKTQCTICQCAVKHKTKIKDEYCSLENIGEKIKWDIYDN
jgi:hypothetical protein